MQPELVIQRAKHDWKNGRLDLVTGDEHDFVRLPE